MQICKTIMQVVILYAIYLIGNGIQQVLHLSIPGSVIGMILLFILLSANVIKVAWIKEGAGFFVRNLTFFFIPATVGILDYAHLFAGKGSLLIVIVLVSTVLVIAGSGLVGQWFVKRRGIDHD
ncbi:CidA/LrgA family protein [Lentibacillus songyuanensis]|uniref:CidA/LrgA family protein n=1 Tax=Lentibacillus songyuanensis TaxID=3136161 RepID=UPI0031B9C6DD